MSSSLTSLEDIRSRLQEVMSQIDSTLASNTSFATPVRHRSTRGTTTPTARAVAAAAGVSQGLCSSTFCSDDEAAVLATTSSVDVDDYRCPSRFQTCIPTELRRAPAAAISDRERGGREGDTDHLSTFRGGLSGAAPQAFQTAFGVAHRHSPSLRTNTADGGCDAEQQSENPHPLPRPQSTFRMASVDGRLMPQQSIPSATAVRSAKEKEAGGMVHSPPHESPFEERQRSRERRRMTAELILRHAQLRQDVEEDAWRQACPPLRPLSRTSSCESPRGQVPPPSRAVALSPARVCESLSARATSPWRRRAGAVSQSSSQFVDRVDEGTDALVTPSYLAFAVARGNRAAREVSVQDVVGVEDWTPFSTYLIGRNHRTHRNLSPPRRRPPPLVTERSPVKLTAREYLMSDAALHQPAPSPSSMLSSVRRHAEQLNQLCNLLKSRPASAFSSPSPQRRSPISRTWHDGLRDDSPVTRAAPDLRSGGGAPVLDNMSVEREDTPEQWIPARRVGGGLNQLLASGKAKVYEGGSSDEDYSDAATQTLDPRLRTQLPPSPPPPQQQPLLPSRVPPPPPRLQSGAVVFNEKQVSSEDVHPYRVSLQNATSLLPAEDSANETPSPKPVSPAKSTAPRHVTDTAYATRRGGDEEETLAVVDHKNDIMSSPAPSRGSLSPQRLAAIQSVRLHVSPTREKSWKDKFEPSPYSSSSSSASSGTTAPASPVTRSADAPKQLPQASSASKVSHPVTSNLSASASHASPIFSSREASNTYRLRAIASELEMRHRARRDGTTAQQVLRAQNVMKGPGIGVDVQLAGRQLPANLRLSPNGAELLFALERVESRASSVAPPTRQKASLTYNTTSPHPRRPTTSGTATSSASVPHWTPPSVRRSSPSLAVSAASSAATLLYRVRELHHFPLAKARLYVPYGVVGSEKDNGTGGEGTWEDVYGVLTGPAAFAAMRRYYCVLFAALRSPAFHPYRIYLLVPGWKPATPPRDAVLLVLNFRGRADWVLFLLAVQPISGGAAPRRLTYGRALWMLAVQRIHRARAFRGLNPFAMDALWSCSTPPYISGVRKGGEGGVKMQRGQSAPRSAPTPAAVNGNKPALTHQPISRASASAYLLNGGHPPAPMLVKSKPSPSMQRCQAVPIRSATPPWAFRGPVKAPAADPHRKVVTRVT